MTKRTFLVITGFCAAVIFSGGVMSQGAQASVIYVSKRIKIVRPAAQPVPPEQQAGAVKPPVEPGQTEAAQPAKTPEETAAKGIPPVSTAPAGKTEVTSQPAVSTGIPSPETLFGKSEQYYSRKDRIDPFAPFLHKPEVEAGSQGSEVIKRAPLTPLEKIAVQQLKLTAILSTPNREMALVQEPSGKGYILNMGTYIGEKGGQVSQILKDRVIIEEPYKDVFGKTAVRKIELKLQKQTGE